VSPCQTVWILYKNWRNQTVWRRVRPIRIWFGKTQHHPREQWFLDAIDLDKNTPRSFAMIDIARTTDAAP
jgi:hypothetical protein